MQARLHPKLGTTTSWVGVLAASTRHSARAAVDEGPVLLVRVHHEARLAQRVHREVGGEGGSGGEPLQRTRALGLEQGGLAGEGLDEQHLVAPGDRGEDGVAGKPQGVSGSGRRPVTVMLRTSTSPFAYGSVRRTTSRSRSPAEAMAAR